MTCSLCLFYVYAVEGSVGGVCLCAIGGQNQHWTVSSHCPLHESWVPNEVGHQACRQAPEPSPILQVTHYLSL